MIFYRLLWLLSDLIEVVSGFLCQLWKSQAFVKYHPRFSLVSAISHPLLENTSRDPL